MRLPVNSDNNIFGVKGIGVMIYYLEAVEISQEILHRHAEQRPCSIVGTKSLAMP